MADLDRGRSFIERYVIERATHFRAGHEQEDAWQAALDAKSIYRNILAVAKNVEPPPSNEGQASAGAQNVSTYLGAFPNGGIIQGATSRAGAHGPASVPMKAPPHTFVDRALHAVLGIKREGGK